MSTEPDHNYRDGDPATMPPAPVPRPSRRRRILLIGGVIAVLVVAAGGLVAAHAHGSSADAATNRSRSYRAGWDSGTIDATLSSNHVVTAAAAISNCATTADREQKHDTTNTDRHGNLFTIKAGQLDQDEFLKGCYAALKRYGVATGTAAGATPSTTAATETPSDTPTPEAGGPVGATYDGPLNVTRAGDMAGLAAFLGAHLGKTVTLHLTWTHTTAQNPRPLDGGTIVSLPTGFQLGGVCGCWGGIELDLRGTMQPLLDAAGTTTGTFTVTGAQVTGAVFAIGLEPAPAGTAASSAASLQAAAAAAAASKAAAECAIPATTDWTDYTYDPRWSPYQRLLWDAGVTLSQAMTQVKVGQSPTLAQVNATAADLCIPIHMAYTNVPLAGTKSGSDCFTSNDGHWLWAMWDRGPELKISTGEVDGVFLGDGTCPDAQKAMAGVRASDLLYSNDNYTMDHGIAQHPNLGVPYHWFDQWTSDDSYFGDGGHETSDVDDFLAGQFDVTFYCFTCDG